MPGHVNNKTGGDTPWAIMRPVRGQVRLAMLLSACGAVLGMAALAQLAWLADSLLRAPHAWPWHLMLGAAACTVAAYVLRLTAFQQSHFAAFRLETVLRTELSAHLARVPLGQVQQLGAGALAKVLQDDVKELHIFIADSTPLFARAYALPPLTCVVLLWLDWRLALAAGAVLLGGFGVLSLAMRGHGDMTRQYNAARERVSAAVIEFVQAMPVVRSFDTGRSSFGRYQAALDTYLEVLTRWYRGAGFSARFSMAVLNPMPPLAVLLWLGAWLSWHDSLSFGAWLAVLLLGTGMAEAMLPLMLLNHMVEKSRLSIARIVQVLRLPALPMPVHSQRPADASVVFEDVDFSYASGDEPALRNISFHAPAGSITALVGPSGAGKSTVARLIGRFWDAGAGRILVGGVDVRAMDADTLMSHVGMVFQDTFLFADSIANNIRLGLPAASLQDVQAAARAAQAHDFIMALPQGYETQAGEQGLFLSGGQRQRITIARAILQDRPILVLDEATAFADPENEAALVAALSALMRGKTVLMVAHRLSTICDAQQILVFERGQLVQTGRHAGLLAEGGVYARLWASHEQAQRWALHAHAPLQPPGPATPLQESLF
ncbi:ABC transporter ATP-binding protein [Janthinobacterium sp. BJB401]|uniref:ABC transporter ATP-binding protein n=1 Tax=Janthinobacterium sp. BJB401 TaxID=2745934 RepID=UPI0020CCADF6|nr:ABC transporter ATP-binding protein [Janthinobacterium sp. BJB401]